MAQTKVQLLQPDLGDVIDFDSSTLFMDGADNRVGIRNTNPQYELDVTGTINATNFRGNIQVGTIDDWIVHAGDTNTKFGFPANDVISFERGGGEALRITTANAILTAGVTAEPLYPHYTTARKIQAEIKGALDVGQTRHHGSLAVNCTNSNSFIGLVRSDNTQTDGTGIGVLGWSGFDGTDFHQAAAIEVLKGAGAGNDDQPGHMIFKTNAGTTSATEKLRITSGGDVQVNGGDVHIDANGELAVFETDTNLAFTNSGKLAFDYSGNVARIRSTHNGSGTTRNLGLYIANTAQILLTSTQTKVNKEIIVGLQGGNDVTKIGGGSGIGAYIQLDHASSGINTKLMGNNDSYLNQFHGNLAIGEDAPDGNKLLIRAASTVGTTKGHIMLTGDGATNGEGPQIVFSESGSGSNFAGAYIGHIREGSNSTGSLVFGTRATGGDANTVPIQRLRIWSDGQATFDRGAPASADKTIARFQCESSRKLDIVWHDSGSLMGFDTPGNHSYIFKVNGSEKLRIASTEATFAAENININRNAGDPFLSFQTSGTSNAVIYGGASSGLRAFTKPSGGSLTSRVKIYPSGKVTINPYNTFHDPTHQPTLTLSNESESNLYQAGKWSHAAIGINNTTHTANGGSKSQIVFGYLPRAGGYDFEFGSAYIGATSISQSGAGKVDLVFGTKDVTSDTQPSEKLRITSANVIGVMGPNINDYTGWHTNSDAVIAFREKGNIISRSEHLLLSQNFRYDSSDIGKFQENGYGTLYTQACGSIGQHEFYITTNNNTSGQGAAASMTPKMKIGNTVDIGAAYVKHSGSGQTCKTFAGSLTLADGQVGNIMYNGSGYTRGFFEIWIISYHGSIGRAHWTGEQSRYSGNDNYVNSNSMGYTTLDRYQDGVNNNGIRITRTGTYGNVTYNFFARAISANATSNWSSSYNKYTEGAF